MRKLLLAGFLLAFAGPLGAQSRASLLEVPWGHEMPAAPAAEAAPEAEAPKPLLVHVRSEDRSQDQDRFDSTVVTGESVCLGAKFFEVVRIPEHAAREHPLFRDLKFTAPAIVVFDSTRKSSGVAAGRASAMKVFQVMCSVGQADYETPIAATVQEARNLLATFDRVEAADGAMAIKQNRVADAAAKGDAAKARQLERELEAERAVNDRLRMGP
jgi:hypothetical protein